MTLNEFERTDIFSFYTAIRLLTCSFYTIAYNERRWRSKFEHIA